MPDLVAHARVPGLAAQLRQQLVAQAGALLAALPQAVQTHLTGLMDEPAAARQMQQRRASWQQFQRCQGGWIEGTLKAWQDALDAPAGVRLMTQSGSFELVDTEAVENHIIASRLVQSLLDVAAEQVNALRQRLKSLNQENELAAQDIVQPESLLLPLVEQWSACGMAAQDWPAVNATVQQLMVDGLSKAYAQCNHWLIAQGVLPVLAQHTRIIATSAAPTRALPGGGAALELGVLDELHQLLARLPASADLPAKAPLPDAGAHALLACALPELDLPSSTATRSDYAQLLGQLSRSLRQQSNEIKARANSDSEKAIIELVALMFQSILQEERLASGVRVWFARLQMPVLRVALAEPEFFSQATHPARQLIDHMGSCALGFDASAVNASALEKEIKRIVQVIEQYPESGQRVYQKMYAEFQTFLAQHLSAAPTTQKLLGVAQQLEQQQTLTVQYTIELRDQIKDLGVAQEIRDFLFKVWAEVLALAALRQGAQDAQTLRLKKAASELIWCASAKPQHSDRAQVMAQLPALLQSLRQGMSLLGLSTPQQDAHIKSISAILADAFLAKTPLINDQQIQALAEHLAKLEDEVNADQVPELTLDAAALEALLGDPGCELEVLAQRAELPHAQAGATPALDLGSWFELDHHAHTHLVQYVWRSPLRQLHLFSAPNGHSYLLQSQLLAAYLQAGLLQAQEDEPLTTRATRKAMHKLHANPERLLA